MRPRVILRLLLLLCLSPLPGAASQPPGEQRPPTNGERAQPQTAAGEQLIVHVQRRDQVVRQVETNAAILMVFAERNAEFRSLLGDHGGFDVSVLTRALAEQRRRADELLRDVQRALGGNAGTNPRGEAVRLIQTFDGRFPPNFTSQLTTIESNFRVSTARLRDSLEGHSRIENLVPRQASAALLAGVGRYQERVQAGLQRVRDITFPVFVYEMIGLRSFDAMAEVPLVERFVQTFKERLNTIEAAARSVVADSVPQRAELLVQLDQVVRAYEENARQLQSEKATAERTMIEQAERNFRDSVNEGSFKWLLVIFGIAFVILFCVPWLYRNSATATIAGQILTANFILQFCTVFILTASIVLLGIGRFIQPDQLPVLLAGISGYVLGQLGRNQGGQQG